MVESEKKEKMVALRLPLGLYNRLSELAAKNKMNVHAYCIKQLWINSKWDGTNPQGENRND